MASNPKRGTYCLVIHVKADSNIPIGKLDNIKFKKGYYVYVGSALNSLNSRIKRHLSNDKKIHWHVDYLLDSENSRILDVIYVENSKKLECMVAREHSVLGTGVKGFGCSDCKCDSHLFYFKEFELARNACNITYNKLNLEPKVLDNLKI
ncbi:MAG: GIY-YIG nuclease family protein [Methanobacteriaceae archaeon]|nr:GIY-YIG nuclease family protein [Methanobacteriaceae archaeon]